MDGKPKNMEVNLFLKQCIIKQLLDLVFVISRITLKYKGGKFLKKLWCCVGGE